MIPGPMCSVLTRVMIHCWAVESSFSRSKHVGRAFVILPSSRYRRAGHCPTTEYLLALWIQPGATRTLLFQIVADFDSPRGRMSQDGNASRLHRRKYRRAEPISRLFHDLIWEKGGLKVSTVRFSILPQPTILPLRR